MKNPFIFSRPITDPKNFFDREEELGEIFKGIRNQYNISLIGERKIGKTSLLNMVCHPDKMREYGVNTEKTLIVSIDSSDIEKGESISVWRHLLSLLYEEIQDENVKEELNGKVTSSYVRFSDVVKTLSHVEKDVVLIFDEFEAIGKNMKSDFFENLRHLAQKPKLTCIVSTCRDLLRMTKDRAVGSSPLFNVFVTYFLGLFSENQSKGFIKIKFKNMEIQEKHINSILEICGPHPFFIQLFCSLLFESLIDEESNLTFQDAIKKTIPAFTEYSDIHFKYYWSRFDETEKDILLDIALEKKTDHDFEYNIVHDLERRGFLVRNKGKYKIFSRIFEEWILKHKKRIKGQNPFIRAIVFSILLMFVIIFLWIVVNLIFKN
ncbi:MAG: AAA-like domain-containing protein [Theionarchaea archaeon]|nr:AAA-like domain-containing protein [Theionarchaea archaeon]